jgi:hypothetical protein
MTMWTRAFWLDTLERAVKTFAQAVVAGIGANAVGVMDLDWVVIVSVSATAALVSVLTSIGSMPFNEKGTASLTNAAVYR